MTKTYHLLIPEYVPLENKGEEAIVRGIAEVLFPNDACEIHLFDIDATEYRFRDGIHAYPGKWFFAPWMMREFGLGLTWRQLHDSTCSLIRNGLHKVRPNFVKQPPSALAATVRQLTCLAEGHAPGNAKERCLQQILACDYVVAGHDGALNEQVCHVIDAMRRFGKASGIFGVSLRSSFRSKAVVEVHHATLRHCRFLYCRNADSVETVRRYFPDLKPVLAPDPAFGMLPAKSERVDRIIDQEELGEFFRRPVVMCTACEPAPIARHCFENIRVPSMKLAAHRQLFADLVQHVVQAHNANVLFLPHALGPGAALDDRVVAREILDRAQISESRARLLTCEYSARELKGLISRAELLVAERIHSMIGATGVHTPFLCLGSRTDRRVKGIIESMLGLEDSVYLLNRPDAGELKSKFDDIWNRRSDLRTHIIEISGEIKRQLANAATVMRECIMESPGSG